MIDSSEGVEECELFDKLTIFPEANIRAVVFGSLIRIITAAKRCIIIENLINKCSEDLRKQIT